jgi:non-ribosomal peptide synthetase component E (peptide arylation enzyme)
MLASASAFLQCCHDWQVSVLDLPTAYWHELAIDLHQENLTLPPALRLVIIGGEKALWDPYLAWQKQVDQRVQLLNTYGPTESTIVATSCDLSEGDGVDTALHEVLIGRPVNNAQAYILDRALQPVPIGVAGELHIGGAGLARGYLRDPRLTAERFIPDPFGPEPGARLYKTGDLARYRPNGSIQFLGRVDHQVKVRGFRVEPGEIEAALNQHPRIREALVVAQDNAESQKRLVAYLVPDPGAAPTTTELRHFLQPNLPEYMVPSAFVMLDALPLTPSGKVDHDALPAPDGSRPDMEQAFVAPRTAVEEVLAGIWAEVLGIERVGVHDNFFELGGHSLLATRVIARARNVLQVQVPLVKVFQAPTVAALAEAVISLEAKAGQTEKIAQVVKRIKAMPAEEVHRMLQERESVG